MQTQKIKQTHKKSLRVYIKEENSEIMMKPRPVPENSPLAL